MICVCGEKMRLSAMGSRSVEGEDEAVHTSSYSCEACGRIDFSPKMAADTRGETPLAVTVARHNAKVTAGMAARERAFFDYEQSDDGGESGRSFTYRRSGRWRRTMLEETGKRARFRYHVRIGGVYVRVPWIAWAMFS